MTTLGEWAAAYVQATGLPTAVVPGVVAQAVAEGSQAQWNPLDTTQPATGDRLYNSAGVRDYPNKETGISATVITLHNGDYPAVLAATTPEQYVTAVANSPWGTWYQDPRAALATLDEVQADYAMYSSRLVAGSTEPASPVQSPLTGEPADPAPAGQTGGNMAFLAQQPGQDGVWVVAGDLSSKEPVLTAEDAQVLLKAGYAKLALSAAQLARIPTVPEVAS